MKTISLEYVKCGFCESESYEILYSAPRSNLYAQCSIVQCSTCGLVRTNPRPSQNTLFETYTDGYYSRKPLNIKSLGSQYKIFAMKHGFAYLYPFVIPFPIPREAVICDVGCGSGQWLTLMRAAHPKTHLYGFEIDTETASIAAQSCQGTVHSGNFLENNWAANSFDFITFWEVLEHVENPKEIVQEVKRLLKPGGYMIVSLPDIQCIYSKLFRQFWWPLAFDAHLYHFSKETLTKLTQTCGFEPSYAPIPLIHPGISNNLQNYLKEMEFKGDLNTGKHSALSSINKLVTLLDKTQLPRLIPDHLLMYARKP